MSIQDNLDKANANIKRKLFDNNIRILGNEILAVKLQIEENQYGDEEFEVIKDDKITVIITFPDDKLMIESYSGDDVSQTNFMLYDIIPIQVYAKFEDGLKVGDLILFKYIDENNNVGKVMLKVTRLLADFNKSLVWKQYQCAMYHFSMNSALKGIVDRYLLED